jgi:hypothetical protein
VDPALRDYHHREKRNGDSASDVLSKSSYKLLHISSPFSNLIGLILQRRARLALPAPLGNVDTPLLTGRRHNSPDGLVSPLLKNHV